MAIELNHTIVPARDKEAAARFFAEIMGLEYSGPRGHFAPVRINDALTLDFDNADPVPHHHYAFHVSDAEFDAILGRVKARGLAFGAEPGAQHNSEINHRRGGRGIYFKDPNGHSYELLTVS